MQQERATKRQQELLQFVDDFIRQNGYGPSYREIMRGQGYKSVSTVAIHVESLITKGYLRRKDNSARSLEVVGRSQPVNIEKATEVSVLLTKHIQRYSLTNEQIEYLKRALEPIELREAVVVKGKDL